MVRVYVAVATNIDPVENIRRAVLALRRRFGPLVPSRIYSSPALGGAGNDFYNLVVGFDSDERAIVVNAALKTIEADHGRDAKQDKSVSCMLDLDLLTYGSLVLREDISIPRDDILKYSFVLKPLAEIAPDGRHPELGLSYAALWADFVSDAVDLVDVTHLFDPPLAGS